MKKLDVSQERTSRHRPPHANPSQEIIPPSNAFLRSFLDLLKKIFVYDPAKRITAKEALQHHWFKELATPDDGTEAAKIKREREEEAAAARRQRTFAR
jgi:dual-specificity kinase